MNNFRRKLSADGSGVLDITDIKRFYNAKGEIKKRAGRVPRHLRICAKSKLAFCLLVRFERRQTN